VEFTKVRKEKNYTPYCDNIFQIYVTNEFVYYEVTHLYKSVLARFDVIVHPFHYEVWLTNYAGFVVVRGIQSPTVTPVTKNITEQTNFKFKGWKLLTVKFMADIHSLQKKELEFGQLQFSLLFK